MSTYEWEEGKILIPKKLWAGFIKKLRDAYNKRQSRNYLTAKAMYWHLKETHKGKRKKDINYKDQIRELLCDGFYLTDSIRKNFADLREAFGYRKIEPDVEWIEGEKLKNALVSKDNDLILPKKKSFALAGPKTARYAAEDGTIFILHAEKAVLWSVQENNHACDNARESFMARILFEELFDITRKKAWTRNSGGDIVGNDEHNRASTEDGGGANYVKERFGPKVQNDIGW